ncbi:MAG TPA: hypothetical protein GX707_21205, partial [Epulopiscium sp.]|nr:hypothetical protein [Candidatus Epulonipiscium sp.]
DILEPKHSPILSTLKSGESFANPGVILELTKIETNNYKPKLEDLIFDYKVSTVIFTDGTGKKYFQNTP